MSQANAEGNSVTLVSRWEEMNTVGSSKPRGCKSDMTSANDNEGSWQRWSGINRSAATDQTHRCACLTSVIIPRGLITPELREIRVLIQMFRPSMED